MLIAWSSILIHHFKSHKKFTMSLCDSVSVWFWGFRSDKDRTSPMAIGLLLIDFFRFCHFLLNSSCAEPEEGTGGLDPTPKNHKNIGFSSNTGPDPLEKHCYQASIQCWGIIGTPAKRNLIAFRWRVDDGPLIVVLAKFTLPSSHR